MNSSMIKRLKEIAGALLKYESNYLLERLELKLHLPLHKRIFLKKTASEMHPESLRKMFEELGGAFIKLGQLLALRPDLVGEKYSKEFEKLLDNVPPESPATIQEIIKDIPFSYFDLNPLGSASVAQVHKAVINKQTVAVKIRRPGIVEKFRNDIQIMEFLALKLREKEHSIVDPVEIVEEFKKYTERELDFRHEASNIKRFSKNFSGSKDIVIPKILDEYTREDLIVMEFIEGKNILSSKIDNKGVIKKVTDAVYKMLFEDRFFHADLHPGNIFITKGKKIAFLDFGIVGHIDRQLEEKLFKLFSAMVEPNIDKVAEALIEIQSGKEVPDENALKEGLYNVFSDYYNEPMKKMDFSAVFYGCINVAKKSKIKIPAQLVLFGKSLVTLEGFCRQVDPNFNIVVNARPYLNKILYKKISPGSVLKNAKKVAVQFYDSFIKLPDFFSAFSRKFSQIEERIIDIDNTFRTLTEIVWRISKMFTVTIIFATLFISSVILLDKKPLYAGISVFSWFGFGISILLFIEIIILYSKKIKD